MSCQSALDSPVCLESEGGARAGGEKPPTQTLLRSECSCDTQSAASVAQTAKCLAGVFWGGINTAVKSQRCRRIRGENRETYHFGQSPARPARMVPVWWLRTQTISQKPYVLRETTPPGASFDCKSASAALGGHISAGAYSESRLSNDTITS